MPRFDILRESRPSNSWRVQRVRSAYDITAGVVSERFVGEIVLPESWRIGVITGRSGTGKSTIARELWPSEYVGQREWISASVIDDIDSNEDDALFRLLHRVGFSSIPSWLKPYSVLSQGEKMRVELARAMSEKDGLCVMDEFTSTVDRDVAKFACLAIRKAVKSGKKKLIAVSCHEDFIPWLEPDWIFDTNRMAMRPFVVKGSRCNLPSENATEDYGKCLDVITISIQG